MTGLAIWGTGAPKLFCALIGTPIGYAAAAEIAMTALRRKGPIVMWVGNFRFGST
jgi:hypothetical protein